MLIVQFTSVHIGGGDGACEHGGGERGDAGAGGELQHAAAGHQGGVGEEVVCQQQGAAPHLHTHGAMVIVHREQQLLETWRPTRSTLLLRLCSILRLDTGHPDSENSVMGTARVVKVMVTRQLLQTPAVH